MRGWVLSALGGLGRDLLVGRIDAARRSAVAALIAFGTMAIFAIAALCYLYGAIFQLLAVATDELTAHWIMVAINLALVLLIYVIYRIYRSSVHRAAAGRAQTARAERLAASLLGGGEAGLAYEVGRAVERGLRKNASSIVVAAAVLGLAIGARPELLNLLRRSDRKKNAKSDDKKTGS